MTATSLPLAVSLVQGDAVEAHPQTSGRFLDVIDVTHGPRNVLGEFFLKADWAARQKGIELHFTDFDEMVAVNRKNSNTWKPLIPLFLPETGMVKPENSFCLVGRNRQGDVVACQAGRFFDWRGTTFKAEAEALRLFYPDPAAALARGERCMVEAPSGALLGGRVSYSGGAWYRPDYRGQSLAVILSRLSRAIAHARWGTEMTIAVMTRGLYEKGFGDICGYTHQEVGFALRGFPLGAYDGALAWVLAHEALADIARFPEHLGAEVDGRVDLRRAEK